MSKLIYQPSGKAKEYALWACNLYNGCSNNCSYCYCKRGVLGSVMGGTVPKLKTGLKDEEAAFKTFEKELKKYRETIIRDGGLFFSFSTDPCLPETIGLTLRCIDLATDRGIPCSILTKRAEWIIDKTDGWRIVKKKKKLLSIGFSFSGWEQAEPGASPESERIKALRKLSRAGIRTFASFEPILDIGGIELTIRDILPYCDEFKFGLLSGTNGKTGLYDDPNYLWREISEFFAKYDAILKLSGKKVYWKKSVISLIGEDLFNRLVRPQ